MELQQADLHTHTTASDGMQPPRENVRLAKEAGLHAVAITDHDTVAGVREAMDAGQEYDITVVPGVEISTFAGGQDIHVLGYYVDIDNIQFLDRLASLRDTRILRNQALLARLSEIGMPITHDEIQEANQDTKKAGDPIGRPHIAQTLIHKGYVASMQEAFDRYLGKEGAAYVTVPRIDPHTAAAWIHDAGGTAVLAHPGIYSDDELVYELLTKHFDGVEACHSDHTSEQERDYEAFAKKNGLVVTAGSDFHGIREGHLLHGAIGNRKVDIQVLTALHERRGMNANS
ncbi:PHP domain-containing protein [Paenibacillus sp. N1-5-1-14]|uniref:PHP domain-containing protein n=1 Tax=Paenibacillus radicibacter TaxID=2972488 RepID=UPI002158DB50|nr:PHP domain-containing protein [Paenibacillus radicibacter]MCR8641730.1 PHP domain-containing protein [Paenibacillus radicibacter]